MQTLTSLTSSINFVVARDVRRGEEGAVGAFHERKAERKTELKRVPFDTEGVERQLKRGLLGIHQVYTYGQLRKINNACRSHG